MSTNRAMAFIDGENLTMRYQAMIQKGEQPLKNNVHIPDVLAWNPGIFSLFEYLEVIRATYYTYAVGSDEQLHEWASQIKNITYRYRVPAELSAVYTASLNPKVFKKPQKTAKRKGVDISIAVDSLTHAYNDDLDIVIPLKW